MDISIRTLLNRFFIVYVLLLIPLTKLLNAVWVPVLGFLFVCVLVSVQDKTFRRILVRPPVILWSLWCVYAFVNWVMTGIPPEGSSLLGFVRQHFIFPLAMLIMVYYEGMKDLKGTVLTIAIALCVYMLMGLTMQELDGTGPGTAWAARGGEQLGNALPLNACTLIFVVLFAHTQGWLKPWHMYVAVVLGLAAIFAVATRKALGGTLILLMFYLVGRMTTFSAKQFIGLSLLSIMMYASFSWLMGQTLIGKRMVEVEKIGNKLNDTDIPVLSLLGDRTPHYILGWEEFQKHPVTGIGVKNSVKLFNMEYPLHTEYMTQLVENGIIGTTLWLLFLGSIFRAIWVARKYKPHSVWLACLSGMACILFLDLTAWTYEVPHYFTIYGIILATCDPLTIYKENLLSKLKAKLLCI